MEVKDMIVFFLVFAWLYALRSPLHSFWRSSLLPKLAALLKPFLFLAIQVYVSLRNLFVDTSRFAISPVVKDSLAVLSLTSTPGRIASLPKVLHNLAPLVYEVHLNIPARFRNTQSYDEAELATLQSLFPNLRVFRTDIDTGPSMKLIPTLQRVKPIAQPGTVVVTIDDDVLLPVECLRKMIQTCRKQQAVLTQLLFKPKVNGTEYGMLYGNRGVAYPLDAISQECIETMVRIHTLPECKMHDDMGLSMALYKHKVPLRECRCSVEGLDLPFAASQESLSYKEAHRMHVRDEECITSVLRG